MNLLKFGLELYGLSQLELADKLNTNRQQIGHVVNGIRKMPKRYEDQLNEIMPAIHIDSMHLDGSEVELLYVKLRYLRSQLEQDGVEIEGDLAASNSRVEEYRRLERLIKVIRISEVIRFHMTPAMSPLTGEWVIPELYESLERTVFSLEDSKSIKDFNKVFRVMTKALEVIINENYSLEGVDESKAIEMVCKAFRND